MAEKPESKRSKPELIAIFRLEFYRKQKSWKLCQDVRGKTPPDTPEEEKTKHILNETYNIDMLPEPEPEPETGGGDQMEEVSELNQAFFDPGTERNTKDSDLTSTVSSQVWYNTALVQSQQELDWKAQVYQKPEKLQPDHIRQDALQDMYPSPEYTASTDTNYNLSQWPIHTQLWNDHYAATYLDYTEVGPQIVESDMGSFQKDGAGDDLASRPACLQHERWPAAAPAPATPAQPSPWGSLESLAQFERGAALAPHSSERDLRDLRHLHHLHHLHHLRPATNATTARPLWAPADECKRTAIIFDGCDEHPTRDTELSFGAHDFVAGSFMNVAEGRGRGRGGGGDRPRGEGVIRIGMGRPYRLK